MCIILTVNTDHSFWTQIIYCISVLDHFLSMCSSLNFKLTPKLALCLPHASIIWLKHSPNCFSLISQQVTNTQPLKTLLKISENLWFQSTLVYTTTCWSLVKEIDSDQGRWAAIPSEVEINRQLSLLKIKRAASPSSIQVDIIALYRGYFVKENFISMIDRATFPS